MGNNVPHGRSTVQGLAHALGMDAARSGDTPRRQLSAARPYIAQSLGGERQADEFVNAFLACQDRPDTCSYTALYFVGGTVP